jgi:branched-subunit amino acid aminotransferase/4-amino-4-deoxychorismate lyase
MIHGTHNSEANFRNHQKKIFIKRDLFSCNDAKILVFDIGCHLGDGVWEGMR